MAAAASVATPPTALETAIRAASAKYGGVPVDLLEGIWREESGGAYPNPAVNSSGYGGLFGTRNWNASTQAQANTAASILATGLTKSGGNIGEALSYYNSGNLQGGYTSVPGEQTFGTLPPATTKAIAASASPLGAGDSTANTAQSAVTAVSGAVSGVTGSITSAENAIKFVFSYRFLEILGGGVLILAGLYVLARQFQQTFPDPLGVGKRAVAGEQQEKTVVREQRAGEMHTARVKTEQARATELRTRTRHRAKVASNSSKERAKLERSAYIRGAADREGF